MFFPEVAIQGSKRSHQALALIGCDDVGSTGISSHFLIDIRVEKKGQIDLN
jgi:hypothetical protein